MLKRVTFILEKENWQKEISALSDEIMANNIEVHTDSVKNILSLNDFDAEDTLYITDNAICQKHLQDHKLPVIIYLHEYNGNEQFSHAEYAIEQIYEVEYESLELAYRRLTGKPWTILTTPRCIIRETTVEDADSFYSIYSEPSITYYMDGLYEDRADEAAYIQDYIKNVYGFYGYGMWTVLEKTEGEVIGRAGISWREGFDIPELGFVIAVPYQHRGYAYEVCHAILEYSKNELGFTCIQALVMNENKISQALCEKLGFKYVKNITVDNTEYNMFLWHSGESDSANITVGF